MPTLMPTLNTYTASEMLAKCVLLTFSQDSVVTFKDDEQCNFVV